MGKSWAIENIEMWVIIIALHNFGPPAWNWNQNEWEEFYIRIKK